MKTLTIVGIWLLMTLAICANAWSQEIVIKKGDNFWKLSQKYHVSWIKLQKANEHNLRVKGNFNLIYPGQVMFIPEQIIKQQKVAKEILPAKSLQVKNTASATAAVPNVSPLKVKNVYPQVRSRKLVKRQVINLHAIIVSLVDDMRDLSLNMQIVVLFFVYMIIIISGECVRMLYEFYRKKTKHVFVAYLTKDCVFAYIASDGVFTYRAEAKNEEGLRELAELAVNLCGTKALRSIKFKIPRRYKQKCVALTGKQISEFKAYAQQVDLSMSEVCAREA